MAIGLTAGPVTIGTLSSATHTITLTGTNSGDAVVFGIQWNSNTTTISSITCPGESDATLIGSPVRAASGPQKGMQLAYLAALSSGGSKTFTITFSSAGNCSAFAAAFNGHDSASFLDASTSNSTTSTNPSVTLTTGVNNALVVSMVNSNSGVQPTAGSGYTGISVTDTDGAAFGEYNLDVGTAGAKTVDYVHASSVNWTLYAASFKSGVAPGVIETVPTPGLVTGADGVVESMPLAALESGTNDFVDAVGIPLIVSGTNDFVGSAMLPSLVSGTIDFEGTNAEAPAPVLSAEIEQTFLSFELSAPVPTLACESVTGNSYEFDCSAPAGELESHTKDAYLEAPVPTFVAEGFAGVSAAARLDAPVPSVTSTAVVSQIITAQNTARVPTLSSTVAHGTLSTATLATRAPTLLATGYAGSISTASLESPAPTLSAAGYPAFTITFSNVAPPPYLNADLIATLVATYRTWALNLRNGALTEYDNFEFNSYAVFNGVVLACGPAGVVELGAQTTDNGDPINWSVKFGQADFGSSLHKRVPRLYVDGAFSDDVKFTSITVERGSHSYMLVTNGVTDRQQRRVPIGKGPRSRFFQYQLDSVRGCEAKLSSVMVYPSYVHRRVL